MRNITICAKPDAFKSGWIAGAYDAFADDGPRYLDDFLKYGADTGDARTFMAGYLAGRHSRRGSVCDESTATLMRRAAA